MKTFRCKLVRVVNNQVQRLIYIGPFDRIPEGWSIVMRRAA
jgi:hypothetical protein